MNKANYLKELESLLRTNNAEDVDDIIAEYDVHFQRKMADGFSEEEIAARLGKPKEIAEQFKGVTTPRSGNAAGRMALAAGVYFGDIFVGSFFIVLYACIFALGVTAVSTAFASLCIIARPVLPIWVMEIPVMPYSGSLLLAVSLFGFSALSAVATMYCYRFTRRTGNAYVRWHNNTLRDEKYPPIAIFPLVGDVARRKLRATAIISLFIFGIFLVVGYIVLATSAGSVEFWHVWNWFR